MRCGRHTGVYTNWSLENPGLDQSCLMRGVTDVLPVTTGPLGFGKAGGVVMRAVAFPLLCSTHWQSSRALDPHYFQIPVVLSISKDAYLYLCLRNLPKSSSGDCSASGRPGVTFHENFYWWFPRVVSHLAHKAVLEGRSHIRQNLWWNKSLYLFFFPPHTSQEYHLAHYTSWINIWQIKEEIDIPVRNLINSANV